MIYNDPCVHPSYFFSELLRSPSSSSLSRVPGQQGYVVPPVSPGSFPWTFAQMNIPGTPLRGGVPEVSRADARTASSGSCPSQGVQHPAPSRCLRSSHYLQSSGQKRNLILAVCSCELVLLVTTQTIGRCWNVDGPVNVELHIALSSSPQQSRTAPTLPD